MKHQNSQYSKNLCFSQVEIDSNSVVSAQAVLKASEVGQGIVVECRMRSWRVICADLFIYSITLWSGIDGASLKSSNGTVLLGRSGFDRIETYIPYCIIG